MLPFQESDCVQRDLSLALIRIHVLHHAARAPVFGLGIMEELGRLGHRLSAGTYTRSFTEWRKIGCCGRARTRSRVTLDGSAERLRREEES